MYGNEGKFKQEGKMSVFGNIVSAIFGSKHAADVTAAAGESSTPPSATATSASQGSSASPGSSTGSATATATPVSEAQVEAILVKLSDEKNEDYDWKNSIVDLMKLLKLDSSLNARKQLAEELGYTGALDGSADMNIWLHRQVMIKLAESGGEVPESLKS
jgi:hypothetical protein